MISYIKKLIPAVGIIIMFGFTFLSTVVGAAKILHTINESKRVNITSGVPKVLGEDAADKNIESIQINVKKSTPTPSVNSKTSKSGNKTVNNSLVQEETSTQSEKCVITLFGGEYDVTDLKKTHSGGDVFVCNTDMTTSYRQRHGTNLSRMAVYKIGSTQTNTSPSPTLGNQTDTGSSGKCIITLFGGQYDVTSLKTSHSGGDIFVCGSDMTSSYQSRHGSNLSRMVPYKIGQTTLSTAIIPTPALSSGRPTPTPARQIYRDEDDDDRDEIEEEEDCEEEGVEN